MLSIIVVLIFWISYMCISTKKTTIKEKFENKETIKSKVNYIGGDDVYGSLPVSMDKTGFYSLEVGCHDKCKKKVLGWRCTAHKYNNMKNVSLVPEGLRNMCYNYTKKTPLLYDGVRSITNSILA